MTKKEEYDQKRELKQTAEKQIVELKSRNPNLTQTQIADIINADPESKNTTQRHVSRVLKKYGVNTKRLDSYKAFRADILVGVQSEILQNLNLAEKMPKTSIKDAAFSLDKLHSMERLERGKSTSNVTLAAVINKIDRMEAAEHE